jgi:hypothetical protein
MSVQREQALSRAFELIEADQLQEAQDILKPILDTDKDNPDVWWLYAHAVTDPETARIALSYVQRLNPNYPQVDELIDALESRSDEGTRGITALDKEPSFLPPPIPSTLPGMAAADLDLDDDEPDFPDDEADEVPFFQRPLFLLAFGALIFIIIAALVILRPPPEQEGIGPTGTTLIATSQDVSVEASPTLEITPTSTTEAVIGATVEAEVTDDGSGVSTGEEDFSGLYAALTSLNVAESGISIAQTSLGNTLIARVCTEAGPALRQALPAVIMTLAREASALAGEFEAIGANMSDCSNDTTLLMVGAFAEDAQAFADGSLSDAEFQARWQPIS